MWNNDLELKFIEHFHDEPILWDPKHRNYKDKSLNHDAWSRIGVLMDMPVPEVKKKKESLFASYRKYRKMVKNSVRSGAGENDIYKPIWFAYDALDSFLGDGLTPRETINTISKFSRQAHLTESGYHRLWTFASPKVLQMFWNLFTNAGTQLKVVMATYFRPGVVAIQSGICPTTWQNMMIDLPTFN